MNAPRDRLLDRAAPALMALVVAMPLAGCAPRDERGNLRLASNDDPGYSAVGAEVLETGPDGQPRYRLRADSIRQDPASRMIALAGVDMQLADGAAAGWRVQAERGSLPAGARRVTLEGDVRLDGAAVAGAGAMRIRTEALTYDLETQGVVAPGDVRLEMAGRTIEAAGLEADLKQRRAKLDSRVHGRFAP